MNCLLCEGKLKKIKNDPYHYTASGLSRIYLKGIIIWECQNPACGDEEVLIPNIEKLHEVIAMETASQKNRLLPEEIKYLRTYLGFSGADFAKKIAIFNIDFGISYFLLLIINLTFARFKISEKY